MPHSLFLALWLLVPLDVPLPLEVVSSRPHEEWNTRFAGLEGWIGGDGVFSQPLPGERVLWLFGDTLFGRVEGGRREGAVMVNNSLAFTASKPDGPAQFPIPRTAEGRPRSAFIPPAGSGWFWPQSVALVGSRLVLCLPRIEKTDDPGVFGFQQIGQTLAIVNNPQARFDDWTIAYHDIPHVTCTKNRQRIWGSTLLPVGDRLYVYGIDEEISAEPALNRLDRKQLTLARVASDKIEQFGDWEFFVETGWSRDPQAARPLLRGLASEFSVSRLPEFKDAPQGDTVAREKYLLVYTDCGLSDRILARLAFQPEGPWSEPTPLTTVPELAQDKGLFAYNGKCHPWASAATGPNSGRLLINYATNAWKFERLFSDETIYRPRFVTVDYRLP